VKESLLIGLFIQLNLPCVSVVRKKSQESSLKPLRKVSGSKIVFLLLYEGMLKSVNVKEGVKKDEFYD